ncbi:MAG: DUF3313 family protein [Myxococcota bacterium]|nr:DUF3313 family protein [Myxococcota bacterium]
MLGLRCWITTRYVFRAPGEVARLLRPIHLIAILLPLLFGCALAPGDSPRVGKKPVVTPDGLERVDHQQRGRLFVNPDHRISAVHRYVLTQVFVTYKRDSPRFSENEEKRMINYVEEGVAASMEVNGAAMVPEPGPCVLSIGIGLVDVELSEPSGTGASTNQLGMWGAVTMVLDVRDSRSGEPLLRYGRRVSIPGGVQFHDSRPQWPNVQLTLDSLLSSQHQTLLEIVPQSSEIDPACETPEIKTIPEQQARVYSKLPPASSSSSERN